MGRAAAYHCGRLAIFASAVKHPMLQPQQSRGREQRAQWPSELARGNQQEREGCFAVICEHGELERSAAVGVPPSQVRPAQRQLHGSVEVPAKHCKHERRESLGVWGIHVRSLTNELLDRCRLSRGCRVAKGSLETRAGPRRRRGS